MDFFWLAAALHGANCPSPCPPPLPSTVTAAAQFRPSPKRITLRSFVLAVRTVHACSAVQVKNQVVGPRVADASIFG